MSLGRGEQGSVFSEIIESLAIAVILAVVIRLFVFQPFYIPSGSMEPTLMTNDRIIVSKVGYRIHEPARGDVIVFRYPRNERQVFVKRLIGLPGDTVELKDSRLLINGQAMAEPYLPAGLEFANFGPVDVPADTYFCLGDNRNLSNDSRVWGFMPDKNLIGKAVIVYWPLGHLKAVR